MNVAPRAESAAAELAALFAPDLAPGKIMPGEEVPAADEAASLEASFADALLSAAQAGNASIPPAAGEGAPKEAAARFDRGAPFAATSIEGEHAPRAGAPIAFAPAPGIAPIAFAPVPGSGLGVEIPIPAHASATRESDPRGTVALDSTPGFKNHLNHDLGAHVKSALQTASNAAFALAPASESSVPLSPATESRAPVAELAVSDQALHARESGSELSAPGAEVLPSTDPLEKVAAVSEAPGKESPEANEGDESPDLDGPNIAGDSEDRSDPESFAQDRRGAGAAHERSSANGREASSPVRSIASPNAAPSSVAAPLVAPSASDALARAFSPASMERAGEPAVSLEELELRWTPRIHHELAAKARSFFERGETEIRITLDPPELGKLTVKLEISPGRVSAHLVASTPHAAALLERDREDLVRAFESQGIDDVSVHVGSEGSPREHSDRLARRQDHSFVEPDAFPSPTTDRDPGPRRIRRSAVDLVA